MTLMIATLVLNEVEHLPALYQQHKDWAGTGPFKWVFVEGADRVYAEANPDMVSKDGLSVDGTSEWLEKLAAQDDRVVYIPHGFSDHPDPSQGKCQLRNRYLEYADDVKPKFIFVLDGDEHVVRQHQSQITSMMHSSPRTKNAFMFGLRSIWRPPSIADQPLFQYEAVGCLWSVPICRGWRWVEGARYTNNHNTPSTVDGTPLLKQVMRFDRWHNHPYTIHLGFTSSLKTRECKHRYYQTRGEGTTDHRGKYVECRRFFETYQPGDIPPHGAKIIPYNGMVPEVFQEQVSNA